MKKSLTISIFVFGLLVAAGFASNDPGPGQSEYGLLQSQDRHARYYEQIRPLLVLEYGASAAKCDGGGVEPRTASR